MGELVSCPAKAADQSLGSTTLPEVVRDDQRENARREAEARRIAGLSLDEHDAAIEAEALRQQEYEQDAILNRKCTTVLTPNIH